MKKYLLFAVGPIVAAILSLITLPILTWYFTPADVGRFAMLNLVASFTILFFSLGLDQAFMRWFYEFEDKATLFKLSVVPGFILLLLVISFLSSYLGEFSKLVIGINNEKYGLYITFFIIMSYLSRFFPLLLRMNLQGGKFSICQILPKLTLLLLLQFLYFESITDNVEFLLIIQCVSITSVLLFSSIMTFDIWKDSINFYIDKITFLKMLKFGLPLIIGSAAFWALTAIDKLFLKYFISLEELALYSVAVNIAGVAVIFQSIFSTIWAPIVYKWNITSNTSDCIDKIEKMINFVTLISALIICVVALFSWTLVYIFPDNYRLIPFIVVSCLSFPLFYTISEVTIVGINLAKKTVYSMLASIITVVINVILSYILIPLLGVAGAALSTSISMWFFLVIRTELSICVWEKFQRKKMYIVTFFLLIISSLFTLFGERYFSTFMVIWGLCLASIIYLYCSETKKLIQFAMRSVVQKLAKENN